MEYCAIIGDIVDSRKLENRNEIQERYQSLMDELNKTYSDCIVSNFTITIGDEFQVLLNNHHCFYPIVTQILMDMYPVGFRFGIGYGPMDTIMARNISIGSDGPAYHRARAMINQCKLEDNIFGFSSLRPSVDLAINAYAGMFTSYMKSITMTQKKILWLHYKGMTQSEIAKKLSVTQSSISQTLGTMNYNSFFQSQHRFQEYLEVSKL